MAVKVYFKGSKPEAIAKIYQLRDILVGRAPDTLGIAKAFFSIVGEGALSSLKDAFETKSQGGTDEMGISWPPLTKKYLAYGRRFGKGEKAQLKRESGLGKGHHHGAGAGKGLLSASLQAKWKQLFARYFNKLSLTLPIAEAKSRAAKIAWAIIKREGGKTMLETFGNRQVDILRDTGILIGSLSPGQVTQEGDYSKPSVGGGEQQVFTVKPGAVIVGSSVAYARAHNEGLGNCPKRQFLPIDDQVPTHWWDGWLTKASKTLELVAVRLFQ